MSKRGDYLKDRVNCATQTIPQGLIPGRSFHFSVIASGILCEYNESQKSRFGIPYRQKDLNRLDGRKDLKRCVPVVLGL